jgi:hypothetical protein
MVQGGGTSAKGPQAPFYYLASSVIYVPAKYVDYEQIGPRLVERGYKGLIIEETSESYLKWTSLGSLLVHERVHFYEHLCSVDLLFLGYVKQREALAFLSFFQQRSRRGEELPVPLSPRFIAPHDDAFRRFSVLSEDCRCVLEGLALFYQSMTEPAQYSSAAVIRTLNFIKKYSLGHGRYHASFALLQKEYGTGAYWLFPVVSWTALSEIRKSGRMLTIGEKYRLICDLISERKVGKHVLDIAHRTYLQGPGALSALVEILSSKGYKVSFIGQYVHAMFSRPEYALVPLYPARLFFQRVESSMPPLSGMIMNLTLWEETPESWNIVGNPTVRLQDREVRQLEVGEAGLPGTHIRLDNFLDDDRPWEKYYLRVTEDHAHLIESAKQNVSAHEIAVAYYAQDKLAFAESLLRVCSSSQQRQSVPYTGCLQHGGLFCGIRGVLDEMNTSCDFTDRIREKFSVDLDIIRPNRQSTIVEIPIQEQYTFLRSDSSE